MRLLILVKATEKLYFELEDFGDSPAVEQFRQLSKA